MRKALLDTNILLRSIARQAPQYPAVKEAVERLILHPGWEACITIQSLMEFWVVATRPVDVNGLGMSPQDVREEVEAFLRAFTLLPDPPDLLQRWLDLCSERAVCGRPAHDARLVAVMLANGITDLLTLNPDDFKRYPEITRLRPVDV